MNFVPLPLRRFFSFTREDKEDEDEDEEESSEEEEVREDSVSNLGDSSLLFGLTVAISTAEGDDEAGLDSSCAIPQCSQNFASYLITSEQLILLQSFAAGAGCPPRL